MGGVRNLESFVDQPQAPAEQPNLDEEEEKAEELRLSPYALRVSSSELPRAEEASQKTEEEENEHMLRADTEALIKVSPNETSAQYPTEARLPATMAKPRASVLAAQAAM